MREELDIVFKCAVRVAADGPAIIEIHVPVASVGESAADHRVGDLPEHRGAKPAVAMAAVASEVVPRRPPGAHEVRGCPV